MPTIGQQITSRTTGADTCRQFVVPKLRSAGWDTDPHSIAEQRTFTAGRIVVTGTRAIRQKAKKADYLLRYSPEMTLAVVEVKAQHKKQKRQIDDERRRIRSWKHAARHTTEDHEVWIPLR